LSGKPGEYRGPSRQNRHEHSAAIPVAQISEPLGQFTANGNWHKTADETLLWRPGAVGWQFQQEWCIGQGLTPELGQFLYPLTGQPFPLPRRIVRILDRQLRQRIRLPLAEGSVEFSQLADKNPHRPAVGNNMVPRQQQNMLLLIEPNQTPTNHWSFG